LVIKGLFKSFTKLTQQIKPIEPMKQDIFRSSMVASEMDIYTDNVFKGNQPKIVAAPALCVLVYRAGKDVGVVSNADRRAYP
jgi:hypothetical protein